METIITQTTTSYIFPTHGWRCVLLNLTVVSIEYASMYSWSLRTVTCSWNSVTCGDSLPCHDTLSHTDSSALTFCSMVIPRDCTLVTHEVIFCFSLVPTIHHYELHAFLTIFICSFVNFNITCWYWYSAFDLCSGFCGILSTSVTVVALSLSRQCYYFLVIHQQQKRFSSYLLIVFNGLFLCPHLWGSVG